MDDKSKQSPPSSEKMTDAEILALKPKAWAERTLGGLVGTDAIEYVSRDNIQRKLDEGWIVNSVSRVKGLADEQGLYPCRVGIDSPDGKRVSFTIGIRYHGVYRNVVDVELNHIAMSAPVIFTFEVATPYPRGIRYETPHCTEILGDWQTLDLSELAEYDLRIELFRAFALERGDVEPVI